VTQYLGYIALVPRATAKEWLQEQHPVVGSAYLGAFMAYAACNPGGDVLPELRHSELTLYLGYATYTAMPCALGRSPEDDLFILTCRYAQLSAPDNAFEADRNMYEPGTRGFHELRVDDSLVDQIRAILRI